MVAAWGVIGEAESNLDKPATTRSSSNDRLRRRRSHIRTLLMTFFYRTFEIPDRAGLLYIPAPLYKSPAPGDPLLKTTGLREWRSRDLEDFKVRVKAKEASRRRSSAKLFCDHAEEKLHPVLERKNTVSLRIAHLEEVADYLPADRKKVKRLQA